MKSKLQRQQEAKERQTKYNKLPTEQKVILVKSRPGRSKRELNRLQNN